MKDSERETHLADLTEAEGEALKRRARSPLMTKIVLVAGANYATRGAAFLIYEGIWFELTPLPDGEYRFSVKPESERDFRDFMLSLD